MNNLRGRRFLFTALETSVSRAKGIFKLRKIAWSFLDGWNVEKHRDNEDLQHFPESRYIDLRLRTSDVGNFLMDSSEALAPKKKAGIVKTRQKLETAKIHAIVCFQPKVAAILNRGHPYM